MLESISAKKVIFSHPVRTYPPVVPTVSNSVFFLLDARRLLTCVEGKGCGIPGTRHRRRPQTPRARLRGRRGFAGRWDAALEFRGGCVALRGRDGDGRRELRTRTREGAHRESKSKQRPADSDLRPVSSSSRWRPHLGLQCSGLTQLQSNPCSCVSFYFSSF